VRRFFGGLLLLGAIELADGICLDLPSLERRGDLALPFAELLLVSAAHERAFDVDVVAFTQLGCCILAEAIPGDDAMPRRLGVPLTGWSVRPIIPRLTLTKVNASRPLSASSGNAMAARVVRR
jgi:hypothetical protein